MSDITYILASIKATKPVKPVVVFFFPSEILWNNKLPITPNLFVFQLLLIKFLEMASATRAGMQVHTSEL